MINKRRTERNGRRIRYYFSSSLVRLDYLNLVIYKINLFHSFKAISFDLQSCGQAMVPRRKEHSNEFRELVIKHFLNGDSEHKIAKTMLCSRNTIHSMIVKYKKTKCIANIFGRGRKRKTTKRIDQAIQRKVKVDRQKSAPSVRQEITQEFGVTISNQTVRRRLYEIGFYGRVARKRPYVNKASRIKHLNYVKMYENKDMDFWKRVLWSDESKFNLFGTDGKVMVWRAPKEEFQPACTVPTVKHGGGNVKVWGCFAWNGVGNLAFIDGNMTGYMYNGILENNLFQSAVKLNLGKNIVFQHDNDPKHTAHIVKN